MLIKSSISIDNLKYYNDSFIAVDSVSTKEQIIVKTYGFFHRDFFFPGPNFKCRNQPVLMKVHRQFCLWMLPLDLS